MKKEKKEFPFNMYQFLISISISSAMHLHVHMSEELIYTFSTAELKYVLQLNRRR